MREQVVTTRGGAAAAANRAGRGGAGAQQQQPPQQQRPNTRRARPASGQPSQSVKKRARGGTLRRALRFAPAALKLLLAVGAGLLIFKGYRVATSASFFQLKRVEVLGTQRAARERIEETISRAASQTGVWNADLDAMSKELRTIPWVRAATVARVLPSGMRVRVTERQPQLIARTAAGRLAWVDDEGVALGSATPTEQDFIVRGLDESGTDFAHEQNRERVARAVEMRREWASAGHGGRISEVNLDDLRDVRAHLAGSSSQIEVRLGDRDFGKRLARALKALAEVPQDSPRGPVIYLDATRRDNGVTVGFGDGVRSSPNGLAGPDDTAAASGPDAPTTKREGGQTIGAAARAERARREDAAARKKENAKGKGQKGDERRQAEKPRNASAGATRPRRVG